MPANALIGISAGIVFLLGLGHLLLAYFSRAFSPRDALLETRLKEVAPFITSQTTMWRAQVGFHASHSLGAIVFGLIYGYLAWAHFDFLMQSPFLLVLGALVLFCYWVLAKLYWFILPLAGVALAFACYIAGLLVTYT